MLNVELQMKGEPHFQRPRELGANRLQVTRVLIQCDHSMFCSASIERDNGSTESNKEEYAIIFIHYSTFVEG